LSAELPQANACCEEASSRNFLLDKYFVKKAEKCMTDFFAAAGDSAALVAAMLWRGLVRCFGRNNTACATTNGLSLSRVRLSALLLLLGLSVRVPLARAVAKTAGLTPEQAQAAAAAAAAAAVADVAGEVTGAMGDGRLLAPTALHTLQRSKGLAAGVAAKAASQGGLPAGMTNLQGMAAWGALFLIGAVLSASESAITKISPWRMKEFAEEEGPTSVFATLGLNTNKFLSTILITTTACSIYSTALFVGFMSKVFPSISLGTTTFALTTVTLLFGELLPKALGVSNSETVARWVVFPIQQLANMLNPLTTAVMSLNTAILAMLGMRSEEDKNVSQDMLRIVVEQAQKTKGIDSAEGRMIQAVLDMQEKTVSKTMTPRVDMVAVESHMSANAILTIAVTEKYSRIPVYSGDYDNIQGVVIIKDLLTYMQVRLFATFHIILTFLSRFVLFVVVFALFCSFSPLSSLYSLFLSFFLFSSLILIPSLCLVFLPSYHKKIKRTKKLLCSL
jgi:hypothetical protein